MFKQVIYFITKLGQASHFKAIQRTKNHLNFKQPTYLPEIHSDDFQPELKQEFTIEDLGFKEYVGPRDLMEVRTYMPLRYNNPEVNTKYLTDIVNIVTSHLHLEATNEKIDLSQIPFSELRPCLFDVLHELNTSIYLSEHKKRYQIEQPLRNINSEKKFFSFFYNLKTRTVEDFVLDYNAFLWSEISCSHGCINHKIMFSKYGNYDTSNGVDERIVDLFYQNNGSHQKKFVGKVLMAADRNIKVDI